MFFCETNWHNLIRNSSRLQQTKVTSDYSRGDSEYGNPKYYNKLYCIQIWNILAIRELMFR